MTDEEILKAFECCCGDDVNGTHCKDCPAEKYNFDWCSDEVLRQMVDYTKRLQVENAALRERLDKAVELKKPYLEEDHYGGLYLVHYETVVHKIKAYEERAAAEKRLAELKGEKE